MLDIELPGSGTPRLVADLDGDVHAETCPLVVALRTYSSSGRGPCTCVAGQAVPRTIPRAARGYDPRPGRPEPGRAGREEPRPVTDKPVPLPRPPADEVAMTLTALMGALDRAVLTALRHVDTVRDEPRGVLYLNCAWAAGKVRRIILARRDDNRWSLADEVVQIHPWRVKAQATREGVAPLLVNAKLREFARTVPPESPRVPDPRKAPVTDHIHLAAPTPAPPHPVRVITPDDITKVGPLVLNSDGTTTLAVHLKTGEVVPVLGSWAPIPPVYALADLPDGDITEVTPDA